MIYVWDGVSLLFLFSLVMLSASVFTAKTAWFFKEKSRLRGAILWMSVALVCAFLSTEFGPQLPLAGREQPAASAPAPAPVPTPE